MCDILTDQAVKIVRAREQEDETLKAKEQRNELNQEWIEETSSNSTAMMTMQQPGIYRDQYLQKNIMIRNKKSNYKAIQ